ncbi:MAG: hypothetical protein IJJ33_08710 [Victivallales bacterium]|nr:hypothetical protein [Victivallales bacterium]
MRKTEKELEAEKASLMNEMSGCGDLVHGSLFSRYLTCSRPGCKCHAGERHGPVTCLSIVRDGRKCQQYVPRSLEESAAAAVASYNRLLGLIDRVSEINLALLRLRSPGRSGCARGAKGGR